jgi:hypothetical protein
VDAAFAAHIVYGLPNIEDFLLRLQAVARIWCAVILSPNRRCCRSG